MHLQFSAFALVLCSAFRAVYGSIDIPDYYRWLKPDFKDGRKGTLPTVDQNTPNASGLLFQPQGSFFCDSCQAVAMVGRQELESLMEKHTSLSGKAKFDVLLESLLMNGQICHLKRWDDLADKLDLYAVEDMRRACEIILEESDVAISDALGMKGGSAPFHKVAMQLCVQETGLCEARAIWLSLKDISSREGRGVRYGKQSEQFLKENKRRSEVMETDSGLQYVIKETGDMSNQIRNDTEIVTLQYNATLINGISIEDHSKFGESATFKLAELFPGMVEGLKLIGKGGQILLFVPPKLAFDDVGVQRAIGPNMALILNVRLTEMPPADAAGLIVSKMFHSAKRSSAGGAKDTLYRPVDSVHLFGSDAQPGLDEYSDAYAQSEFGGGGFGPMGGEL